MPSVGIDLGTTNTVLASDGTVLPLGGQVDEHHSLPSVVAFLPNGEMSVGVQARNRRPIDPKNTIVSAKRIIGETYRSYRTRLYQQHYPYDLVEADSGDVSFRTRAGLRTPTDIAALIVQAATERTGCEPKDTDAVVAVPATFHKPQRQATIEAVQRAGFRSVGCIDEPIATTLAYLASSELRYAAVYDFGGGTFDLAIVDCSKQPFAVVAQAGEPYLGGDDVDRALATYVADQVLQSHRWDLRANRSVFDRLVFRVEMAKIQLSQAVRAIVNLSDVDEAAPVKLEPVPLLRSTLERVSETVVRRTFRICDEVLARAGLRFDQIDAVLLAGGSTRLPGVAATIEKYFGRPPRIHLDPMHVVAIGANLAHTHEQGRDLIQYL